MNFRTLALCTTLAFSAILGAEAQERPVEVPCSNESGSSTCEVKYLVPPSTTEFENVDFEVYIIRGVGKVALYNSGRYLLNTEDGRSIRGNWYVVADDMGLAARLVTKSDNITREYNYFQFNTQIPYMYSNR